MPNTKTPITQIRNNAHDIYIHEGETAEDTHTNNNLHTEKVMYTNHVDLLLPFICCNFFEAHRIEL